MIQNFKVQTHAINTFINNGMPTGETRDENTVFGTPCAWLMKSQFERKFSSSKSKEKDPSIVH